jgi:hypothetical protein
MLRAEMRAWSEARMVPEAWLWQLATLCSAVLESTLVCRYCETTKDSRGQPYALTEKALTSVPAERITTIEINICRLQW